MKYAKTPQGALAFREGDARLSPADKALLIMVDGKKDRTQLVTVSRSLGVSDDSAVERLLGFGLIYALEDKASASPTPVQTQPTSTPDPGPATTSPSTYMPSQLSVSSGFGDSVLAQQVQIADDLEPFEGKLQKLSAIKQFLLSESKLHLGFFKSMGFSQGIDVASEVDELRQLSLDLASTVEKTKSPALAQDMLARLEPLLARPIKS
jgi:hypothetical protein